MLLSFKNCSRAAFELKGLLSRAVDPLSYYEDLDPAVFLDAFPDADPDPLSENWSFKLCKNIT